MRWRRQGRWTTALAALPLMAACLGCTTSARSEPETPADETATVEAVRRDWPNLLGPDHDSFSSETQLLDQWPAAGPRELWRANIGSGYSAPVIADGRLVCLHRRGDEEIVECLDAATAQHRWEFRYPTSYKCPFEYSSGPYSTPVIHDGRVYAWGAEGKLHCLDVETGELYWRRSLNEDYAAPPRDFPVASSPLVDGDLVVLLVGGSQPKSGIVALDRRTGETRWTATAEKASYATPVPATIHGRRMIFCFTYDGLVSLDAATGEQLGGIRFHAKLRDLGKLNATSPLVVGGRVIVSAYPVGTLCVRVEPDGGLSEVWRTSRRVLDCQFTPLVCRDGQLYGCSSFDGSFRCVDAATGKLQWEWTSDLGRSVQFAAADGKLILLGEHGHLAALAIDAKQPRLLGRTAEPILAGPCFTAPAIAHGRLYLRNEREVVCLDLRQPADD